MRTIKLTITLMLLSFSLASFAKKEKPSIIIKQEIIIDVNIDQAWQILGPQFADAHKWASSISHSQANNTESVNGSSCSERGCNVAGFGDIKENILEYSNSNHVLFYQVTEGMPGMISFMTNYWKLTETADGKTKLEMKMEMKTKGMMGAMMKGMMRKKMTKMSGEVTEEFKFYVEKGKPHPRKLKAIEKKK